MKKYYLIAKTEGTNPNHFSVCVSDSSKGGTVLMEIESESFAEANKMFTFTLRGQGKANVLMLDKFGKAVYEVY